MIPPLPRGRGRAAAAWAAAAWLAAAPAAGAAPRPLRLVDPASGRAVELGPRQGLTHLVFTAVWCRPCVDELPALADFEARWSSGAYDLVLIAVPTRHDADNLRAFAREHAVPGRLLFDPKGDAIRAFGVDKLPTHVVLDENGDVVVTAPRFDDALRQAIAARVRGTAPGGAP